MESITIQGRRRDDVGSPSARRARRDGWVPVNVYGHGEPNLHCYLPEKAVDKFVNEEHHLVTIDVDGSMESGLLKEIQYDSLGEQILHLDFARVRLDEVVETSLVIHTVGSAKGVSNGGILDVLHHEVPVKGQAGAIPEHFEVEVGPLAIGDAIRVGDLSLPAGVECLMDADEPIIIVHAPKGEGEGSEEGAEGEA